MTGDRKHTEQFLLDELRRVAAIVAGKLTKSEFDTHSDVSSATLRRRFGSWHAALLAAELGDRSAQRTVTRKMAPKLSDDDILAELQRIARVVGSRTITKRDVREYSEVLGKEVPTARFGSFAAALRAARLTPAQSTRGTTTHAAALAADRRNSN